MHDRRVRLNDLDVTGPRKRVRDGVRLAIVALAGLAIVFLAFELHRVDSSWHRSTSPNWGKTHAYLVDTGPWPVLVMVFVGLAQWWGNHGRVVLGVVNAVVSLVFTFIDLVGFAMVHFLSAVQHGVIGEVLLPLAFLGLMAMSVAQIVVEIWVAVGERRMLEARRPQLPNAIVVRS